MSSKHGLYKTRFYTKWRDMLNRCSRVSSHKIYKVYGNKGIKVCDKWSDFRNFFDDMAHSYYWHCGMYGIKQTTLDRIDSNGNYEPSNCRWATYSEQNRNRSSKNKLGVTGIRKNCNKFVAYINNNKKRYHIGSYPSLQEAITARENAKMKLWF